MGMLRGRIAELEAKKEAAEALKVAPRSAFDSIEDALAAFAAGDFVIVVDNEDRENEGDLIIAADALTEEKMAFMIRHTSGLICAGCSGSVLDRLELPLMVKANTESHQTAFTVSIDVRKGTTTGIS